ncbi:helix-turn-helix transcriptional regulator [Streptomyces gilvosporeus]|uniref:Helix-turn-helix transcriptional regulator n=1 Tax=Streptomyces gilvosporeus TaxID=553510 RepID=A0A1V0TNG2_9ACTN|nr:LuxR C-terminal-related transcriptional regulator [Streptomyces gilvosporeus]ARF54471.1 helix-turn-helix transcriptional regulator [Streptomyces gilvosporeus]
MSAAAEAGLRRIFDVVDLLIDAVDEENLVPALLPLLLGAVPGDSIVWAPNPDPTHRPRTLPADLLTPDALAAFDRDAAADPLVAHTSAATGTPLRRSTLQSDRAYHALAAYHEVYRPLGAERQLAMSFAGGYADGTPRSICLAINRSGSDFTDDDVLTAALLRTRLAHVLRRLAPPPPQRYDVTRRESAVLALLAHGLTNQQIARRLDISPRTVDKHLEHAYAKLRVGGRVEAANAWLTRGDALRPASWTGIVAGHR